MKRRWRRYRGARNYWLFFLVLTTLISSMFIVLERNLSATITTVACAKAKIMTVETINQTVYNHISNDIQYGDLITVEKDNDGRIVLMQPNTIALNKLMTQTTLAIQNALEKMKTQKIRIPVVQAFDNTLLANLGPKISVDIVPIGTVRTTIINKFEGAGINQTRNRIVLNVEANVQVVYPLINSTIKVSTQVPIAETIIVGNVPNTYMNITPRLP